MKNIRVVLADFSGGITKALLAIFPDIGLQRQILRTRICMSFIAFYHLCLNTFYLVNTLERRNALGRIAARLGFDQKSHRHWFAFYKRNIADEVLFRLNCLFNLNIQNV